MKTKSKKSSKTTSTLAAMNLLVSLMLSCWAFSSQAAIEEDPVLKNQEVGEKTGLFIEYFNYEEYVYSRSKKTELGDNVRVDVGLRYQFNPNTFGRVRFQTDPVENRANNKTGRFEFLGGHKLNQWYFQVDAEVRGDDAAANGSTSGETTVGLDLDSELTFISYDFGRVDLIFYPFNFDGEVGREFNTWDVTRVYFIEGSPSAVSPIQANSENIAEKTIPGIELGFSLDESKATRFYIGVGAVSYLYPWNDTFALPNSPVADRWERREDIGYKAGLEYAGDDLRFELKYVGHTEDQETGSLLKEAASFYAIGRLGKLLFEPEVTYSKAGRQPYYLRRDRQWFRDVTPFLPVYTDYYENPQDWIGKSDFAYSFRLGWETDEFVPYLTYKRQGKHFIFRDRESAHILRTADDTRSHGGLDRIGFGAFFYSGNFLINPEFEYLSAQNPVFSNSSDLREDRFLSAFKKDDYLLFLTVSYSYGPNRVFRP